MGSTLNKVAHHYRVLCGFLALAVFAVSFLAQPPLRADIYRWQDAEGNWHFTDSPSSDVDSERIQKSEADYPRPGATPDAPIQETAEKNGGLFWSIHKAGLEPSYLLGTIHSTDPRITRLRPPVASALDSADRFIMEMVMDTGAMLQYGSALMMTDGTNLEMVLGAPLYAKVVAAMTAYGMPEIAVRQLKPWAVMAMLSMPKPTGGMILDMVLHQKAQAGGKPVSGLETMQEQLSVFESLSMQDQITLLEMTLDQAAALPAMFEQLIRAYLSDDLSLIERLAAQHMKGNSTPAVKRFMYKLNEQRNARMTKRILPYLKQGNSFVAVGALHLAGEKGIIRQLRQYGYVLEPIK